MANIAWPSNPSVGDTYTYNSITYRWTGTTWSPGTAPISLTGPTGPAGLTGPTGPVVTPIGEQGILTKSGANLLFAPKKGNIIYINGAQQTIPNAGVTLAPTALSVGTVYYIYAFMSGGTLTLEASTTGHSVDSSTGVEIKTGDSTRSLVGQAKIIAGPAWTDTATQRFVLSWFNRRLIGVANNFSTSRSTASATFVEVNSEVRSEFLLWSGDSVYCGINVLAQISTSGATAQGGVGVDITSGTPNGGEGWITAPVGGFDGSFGGTVAVSGLAEGAHFVTVLAKVDTGSITLFQNGSVTTAFLMG